MPHPAEPEHRAPVSVALRLPRLWRWLAGLSTLLCLGLLLTLGLDALYAIGLLALLFGLDRWRQTRRSISLHSALPPTS